MRKLLLTVAAVVLLCATGAVQAGASAGAARQPTAAGAAPARHTTTYTAKQRFRTHDGKTITGIRTGTGQVFTGVDKVVETIDPTPQGHGS